MSPVPLPTSIDCVNLDCAGTVPVTLNGPRLGTCSACGDEYLF